MRLRRAFGFLPVVFLLAVGCGDGGGAGSGSLAQAGGAPGGKAKKKGGMKRPKQRNAAPVEAQASGAGGTFAADRGPFSEMRGYVVKGTDELSFRRCGSSRTYFTRVAPPVASRFSQHYRWHARSLFDPVYVVVVGRIVDDTVTVGEHRYTAVVEIRDVLLERSKESPACPAPRKGSMLAQP